MMSSPLKVAVIGCGHISVEHLQNLTRSKHFEVVGVADIVEKIAKTRAKEFRVPYWTTNYKNLLAKKEIEAVLILTTPITHREIAIAALRAGKHVFCEKPLAKSSADCKAIAQAAKRSNRIFLLGYTMRHSPDALNLRNLILDGKIGRPVFFRDIWALSKGSPSPAIHDAKKGGGVLFELSHWLDFILFTFGKPKKVYATTSRFKPDDTTADDTFLVIIDFASGDQAIWSVSWAAKGFGRTPSCVGRHVRPTTDIIGPKGSLHFPSRDGEKILSFYASKDQSGKPTKQWKWETDWGASKNALATELEHFYRCIRNKAKPLCTARDGLAAMNLLEAVIRSSRTGKTVIFN